MKPRRRKKGQKYRRNKKKKKNSEYKQNQNELYSKSSSSSDENDNDNIDIDTDSEETNSNTNTNSESESDSDQNNEYYDDDDRKERLDPSERLLPWSLFYGIQAPIFLVIYIMWSVQYNYSNAITHRYFIVAPTECILIRTMLTLLLFVSTIYIWWWENIGARVCGCCCKMTSFAVHLCMFDLLVSILTMMTLGYPYFFHDSRDSHWPTGLGSTFLLCMLCSGLTCMGSFKFIYIGRKLSTMKSPTHRIYGAKFNLLEEGNGGHEEIIVGETKKERKKRLKRQKKRSKWEKRNGGGDTTEYTGNEDTHIEMIKEENIRTPSATFGLNQKQETQEYRVVLRPLSPIAPITPSMFENMWSTRWGSSTTVLYKTTLRPNTPSICESMEERNMHVVAKGSDQIYFCVQEVAYNLKTQTPGTGYSTARRSVDSSSVAASAWSVSPGHETSPLIICELKILSKEEIWIELRTDDDSTLNIVQLYIQLFETMLRKEHGVYVREILG